ncbi:cation transporter HKT8-like [Benincasa hispida]|uniref:cation transporter HKT8-like n=1 Tax=Benincasa hispida TaxID=102211 RepID=UPI0019001218|nr:cation transporter HKT8-like [Benincasa hispida]
MKTLILSRARNSIFFLLRMNPFWIQFFYFIFISSFGFLLLMILKPSTYPSFQPTKLDLFYTSVSASTVSSMSSIEMEVFSNSQLIILTILMFIGGEIFTSMVGLHLRKLFNGNLQTPNQIRSSVESFESLSLIKFLSLVVLGYLLITHIVGIGMIAIYFIFISSFAKEILKEKGINLVTFSFFTCVSTLASCGYIPTNENMIVFNENSGLLLILIPQILLGNTLYPSCLRLCIWVIGKFSKDDDHQFKADYLLKNSEEIGYLHLLPSLHSCLLVGTVFGFILIQFILICPMEWNSNGLSGLNSYQKVVGILFLSTNSRHSGETIVDLSTLSPTILIMFVVMMYLPAYTSFLPLKEKQELEDHLQPLQKRRRTRKAKALQNLLFSQLSYLVIFIIIICIIERKKMIEDPINFSALNIVLEVISAYGNVGFTTGYSCKRQLHPQNDCVDKWYGFSAKWSNEGKIVLIFVMIFGRLKKFNMDGGKAWKLV